MASAVITANLPDLGQRLAPVEQVGQLITTCGTPAYVHLQLEASRRFYGDRGIPLLVFNDGDQDEYGVSALRKLCETYDADFHCEPYRGHTRGDLRGIQFGLEWASNLGVTILAKFSRRSVPMRHWRFELMHLAATNQQAAAFGRFVDDNPYGLFRTDAVALRVAKFSGGKFEDVVKEMIDRPQNLHVENLMLSFVKTQGGMELWPLLGPDFYRPCASLLQWRGLLPSIYADVARSWSLPYEEEDFTDKAEGVLMQSEVPALPNGIQEAVDNMPMMSDRLGVEASIRAREWAYKERSETDGLFKEHMPKLRELAALCDRITVVGCRNGSAIVSLLAGCPKKLTVLDVAMHPSAGQLLQYAGDTDFRLQVTDVHLTQIEETDLLMIDTVHTGEELLIQWMTKANLVSRFAVIHGTTTYADEGEGGGMGLATIIERLCLYSSIFGSDFVHAVSPWVVRYQSDKDHGLTVLERNQCQNSVLPASHPQWKPLDMQRIVSGAKSRAAELAAGLVKGPTPEPPPTVSEKGSKVFDWKARLKRLVPPWR